MTNSRALDGVGFRPLTVKICGVRTLAAAQAAVDGGADYLGFICYPAARRYLPPEHVAAILAGITDRSRVQAIGVFVNQAPDDVNRVAERAGLDAVQLSGDEPVEILGDISRPVIKAVRPAGTARTAKFDAWWEAALKAHSAHSLLLESPSGGWGGAGERMDWSLARAYTAATPRPRLTLAGGLNPENVAAAVAAAAPDGVDVSTGVETNGEQDTARIVAFLAAARGARQ